MARGPKPTPPGLDAPATARPRRAELVPAAGAWPRRRPALATVPAEPSSPRRAELLPPPGPGRGADPRWRPPPLSRAAPAGPSCCHRRGLAAARTRAGDATGLEALQRARATPAGARALAAPWLRLASPTHTGEGAEGRREGGEKAPEEGGREEEDKAEREERERNERSQRLRKYRQGGRRRSLFVPGAGSTRDKKTPFCPGWWLHPGQKGHGVFCLGWCLQPG